MYQRGRYLDAVQVLDTFRTEHPGSDRVDDAIYLIGMAHQKLGENALARDEFDRLLRDFPQSAHREDALFQKAVSWMDDARPPALDAEPTQSALDAFQDYLERYPEGTYVQQAQGFVHKCLDRLAVKAYLNGQTYLQIRQPKAAVIYFEKALRILPDFSRAGETLYDLGCAYARLGQTEKARQAYQQLLDYSTPERLQADDHLRRLRQKATDALAALPAAAGG